MFEEVAKASNKMPNPPKEITTYSKEKVLELLAEQKKELAVNLYLCQNGLKTIKVPLPLDVLSIVISEVAQKPVSASDIKKAELLLKELEEVTKEILSVHTEAVIDLINVKDTIAKPVEKLNSLYVATKDISTLSEKIDKNILIIFIKEVMDIKREEVIIF